jgi:glycosyltransferase involved in cell wall biosynthesis
VQLRGPLPHAEALAVARSATLFVMPSVDEAFGVAYIEAMAAGVPAIGCRGEDGPEEIARAGDGIMLVAPHHPRQLAEAIEWVLDRPNRLSELSARARATVEHAFTWQQCGEATIQAYADVLS